VAGFLGTSLPGAAGDPESPKRASEQKNREAKEQKAKGKDKDKDKDEEAPPKCSRCGARCGLVAFCRCEPGKKKKPKVEYDVKCDPICVARCGGLACRHASRNGSCCDDCSQVNCSQANCSQEDCCNAWVRQRKVLKKTTTDEEVDTIKRTVEYVCCRCLEPPGCAAEASCTEAGGKHRQWLTSICEWWSQVRW
jgi:hypothetical protein